MFTHDGSARSGLFRIAYPDTGESGDAYDIDMQKEPTTRTGLELPVPSPSISTLTFGTAESGDAYDAEVDQFSGEQMDDGVSSSSHAIERRYVSFVLLIHVPRRLPKERIL